MSERATLPWESCTVDELFEMQLGKMLSAATRGGPRQRPYLANRNVQWNRIDLGDVETMHFGESEDEPYGLRRDDVLVCEGGEIGRTAIWADELDECHFQNAVHRLRSRDGSIGPRYFLHFMRFAAVHGMFRRLSGQTSIAHLTKEGLRQLVVAVPSKDEQLRIAEILDAVDETIRSAERVTAKLEHMKRGLVHDLLTRGIGENGELCDQSPGPCPVGPLLHDASHEGWPTEFLGTIGRITSGATPPRGRPRYWAEGSIPWVKTGEVAFNVIEETEELVTPAALNDTSLRLLPVGTVLIAMYGEGVTRGRCAVLGVAATTNQACAAIDPDRTRVRSQFLFHYLQARYDAIRDLGQGSHQTNISGALLRKMLVSIPPLREQDRIVAQLDAVDCRIAKEKSTLRKLGDLRAGLMDDLLTGRVCVGGDGGAA